MRRIAPMSWTAGDAGPIAAARAVLTACCSYVTQCAAAHALLPEQPKFFLLTSAATAIELAKDYGQWGDADDDDFTIEVCLTRAG